MKNSDMPAMPCQEMGTQVAQGELKSGLTKREQFAAMAMQGMVSTVFDGHVAYDILASDAVEMANALLKQLENNDERS